MRHFAHETSQLHDFAELILDDEAIGRRFDRVWQAWATASIGPDISRYSHQVFAGFSIAEQGLMRILRDPERSGRDPAAYRLDRASLQTDDPNRWSIVYAAVDSGRHLWLRLANSEAVTNWAPGLHPEYHKLPYQQTRIELSLDKNHHAEEAIFNIGVTHRAGYESLGRLEETIKSAQADRQVGGDGLVLTPAA